MAKKESLQSFINKWHTLDEKVLREASAGWNKNTLLTMVRSQFYSPVKTGQLQGSARRKKAVITSEGIKSNFIFAVPYAFRLNKGINPSTGKPFNINKSINPNARSKYTDQAIDEHEQLFLDDLAKASGIAFDKI